MSRISVERRVAELRALQQADPRALIDLYCRLKGQVSTSQLPLGVSFSRMIESIVEQEEREMGRRETTA